MTMNRDEAPAATASMTTRLRWAEVPGGVRAAIEAGLGAAVVEAVSQDHGFSPGLAARVALADGRRAFVKAVSPVPNADSPSLYRSEARVAAMLPANVPTPRLLWHREIGEWVVLAFEDVEGRPPSLPWRPDELARVLAALAGLAELLTPPPIDAPTLAGRYGDLFNGWRELLRTARAAGRPAWLDDWSYRRLEPLAALEAAWAATRVELLTLVHADVRADNLLLTPAGVVFVDWTWASVGPRWFDLLFLVPSVAMQGGPAPWTVFDEHPVSRDADPAAVDATLAALTGFYLWHGRQPAPPGLPTLRAFQRAQAAEALGWLRRRVG